MEVQILTCSLTLVKDSRMISPALLSSAADIYISVVSYHHNVASDGMYVATVSTRAETRDPEKEVQPGLDLLEPIMQKSVTVCPVYCHDRFIIVGLIIFPLSPLRI